MFSFNPYSSPFGYSYSTSKPSYGLYDDDLYNPFSRGQYYGRQDPSSLFRSASFRQPTRQCPASSAYYRPSPQQQSSDEDEDYDPFLSLFGLRSNAPSNLRKSSNRRDQSATSRPGEESETRHTEQKTESRKESQQQTVRSPIKRVQSQDKELDSQRFDSDREIEFKFHRYKCKDPSGISVTVTKDNYIVLNTSDGYRWKNRLPDGVDVSRASCTCANECLKLTLPRSEVTAAERRNEMDVQTEVKKTADQTPKTKVEESHVESDGKMVADEPKVAEQTKAADEEFDPDAPIIEDIIED